MNLNNKIVQFCTTGPLVGDIELTDQLVQYTWKQLSLIGITPNNYTTASCLSQNDSYDGSRKLLITDTIENHAIYIEHTFARSLDTFFDLQGLIPITYKDINLEEVARSIRNALIVIDKNPGLNNDVKRLVKTIIVLHSSDNDIDISYSHPNIPFTIFVSMAKSKGEIVCLRLVESIIHEAMHLKLSMIEAITPLVEIENDAKHYSPWRLEQRPVQGVLHGLFVFKVIFDFYKAMLNDLNGKEEIKHFVHDRMNDIFNEICGVKDLIFNESMTVKGRQLISNLLDIKLT